VRQPCQSRGPAADKKRIKTERTNAQIAFFCLVISYLRLGVFWTKCNVLGLTIGLASSILILLWVQNELSFDIFHKNAGQVYRIASDFGDSKSAACSAGMPAGIRAQLPVIENSVRIQPANTTLFQQGAKRFEEERAFMTEQRTKVPGAAGFAYHVELNWVVFFTGAFAALAIAWITVSYESIKAATVNPVKSLRTE
jgi:ABC-type antimicrobial peptide transport system permease subunit